MAVRFYVMDNFNEKTKALCHNRGMGCALAVTESGTINPATRFVTEHNIAFAEKDGEDPYFSLMSKEAKNRKEFCFIDNIKQNGKFSVNYFGEDDIIYTPQYISMEGGIIPEYHIKNNVPYIEKCMYTFFCEVENIVELPNNSYFTVIGKIFDYWENPIIGKPLINYRYELHSLGKNLMKLINDPSDPNSRFPKTKD